MDNNDILKPLLREYRKDIVNSLDEALRNLQFTKNYMRQLGDKEYMEQVDDISITLNSTISYYRRKIEND